MEKIVIIGSPGAGKSTFARKLGSILNIKVIHLDRVFWRSGWKEKPIDTRIDILEKIVREKQWIIEGTYLGASEPRLNAADTIIFLDLYPAMCLQRIIKRHHEYRGCFRRDIPEGCKDELNLIRILKVLVFPIRGRRTLKRKLRNYNSKHIIKLRSTKEVESFLAQLATQSNEKKKIPKSHSVAGKRQLALARQ
jgi:adenylate kinase family enzyme